MIHRIVACTLSLSLGVVIAPRAQAEGVADAFDEFVAVSIALFEALFYGAEFDEAEKFLQPGRFEGSELVEERHRPTGFHLLDRRRLGEEGRYRGRDRKLG